MDYLENKCPCYHIEVFDDNGCFPNNLNKFYEISTVGYISSPKYILKTNNYFSGKVGSLIIPRDRAIDIDDEFDLKLAKILIKQNEK